MWKEVTGTVFAAWQHEKGGSMECDLCGRRDGGAYGTHLPVDLCNLGHLLVLPPGELPSIDLLQAVRVCTPRNISLGPHGSVAHADLPGLRAIEI